MRRMLGWLTLFSLILPVGLQAQTPEMEYLNRMVGAFKYNQIEGGGECKKVGDYILHCMSAWTNSSGEQIEAVWITKFDPESEEFMAFRFYNSGYSDSGPGWVDGDTGVFVYEGPGGIRARMTQTWSGDTLHYVWHRSVQGGPWEQTSEGSTTKVG